MKSKILISLILILLLFMNLPLISAQDEEFLHEYNDVTLDQYEYMIYDIPGNEGDEIRFVIDSDRLVDCYIKKLDSFPSITRGVADPSDFNDAIYSEKNKRNFDFKWKVPDEDYYFLYVYSTNEDETTFSIKYTDPILEDVGTVCYAILAVFVIIIVIFIIIIFVYYQRRHKPQPAPPPPPSAYQQYRLPSYQQVPQQPGYSPPHAPPMQPSIYPPPPPPPPPPQLHVFQPLPESDETPAPQKLKRME